jgi:hypothetical protein
LALSDFLKGKPQATRYILGVFGKFYGRDKDPASFKRVDFKAHASHLANRRPVHKERMAPRTRKNNPPNDISPQHGSDRGSDFGRFNQERHECGCWSPI